MAKLLSGTRIYGNLTVDTWANAASANISGTTTSTSTTTGALVVAGGAGIAGNINVGGTYANLSTGGSTGSFISIQGGTPSGGTSTVKLNAIDWSGIAGNSVNLWYGAQQGGVHSFRTGQGQLEMVRISQTSSAVNYLNLTGAVTGSGPTLSAQGTDTNIDLVLGATGTGNISTVNPVRITNGNVSVSTTSGALQVTGGVGIGGDVYSGGNHYLGTNTRAVPTVYYSNSATGQYSAFLAQRAGIELWLAGANPSENYVIRNNALNDWVTVANITEIGRAHV